MSDTQDYFKYILRKHQNVTNNAQIRIYVDKIQNRTTFEKLLTPEAMQLFSSTKSKITKNKTSENIPHLEATDVVLIHWNIVKNVYQQPSKALYIFVPNKSMFDYYIFHPKIKTFKNLFLRKG